MPGICSYWVLYAGRWAAWVSGSRWDLSLTWLKLGSYSTWPLLLTCRIGAAMASVRSKPNQSLFMIVCKKSKDTGKEEATGHPITRTPPKGVSLRGDTLARNLQTHLGHSRDDKLPTSPADHQLRSLAFVDQDGGYHRRWWPLTWDWGREASPTPSKSTTQPSFRYSAQ